MRASSGLVFLTYYTILGAGGMAVTIFFPNILDLMGWDVEAAHIKQHHEWYNIMASLFAAVAVTCFLGRHDPIKIGGVFVVQIAYKLIWITTTVIPGLMAGTLSRMNLFLAAVLFSYVILDVLYVPYRYILTPTKELKK